MSVLGCDSLEGACARKGPDRGYEEDGGGSDRGGNGARLHDFGWVGYEEKNEVSGAMMRRLFATTKGRLTQSSLVVVVDAVTRDAGRD